MKIQFNKHFAGIAYGREFTIDSGSNTIQWSTEKGEESHSLKELEMKGVITIIDEDAQTNSTDQESK